MPTIQNLLLPSPDTCMEEAMYYRCPEGTALCTADDGGLCIPANTTILFDTYFNGLSIEKWKKYTEIGAVTLNVRLCGAARLVLMSRVLNGDSITSLSHETLLCRTDADEPAAFSAAFPEAQTAGMYCFALETTEPTVFYGGSYTTDAVPLRSPRIALNICTFRREAFVLNNLSLLKRHFLEDPDAWLHDKLEIFVIDNAGSLEEDAVKGEHIHLFRNKNVGGSGGFARGMIEIGKVRESLGITHILISDDDIVFEPEALYRTCALLAYAKDCYRSAFIGGAMLRLDDRYVQVESGAFWNQGELISGNKGFDMRDLMCCLRNETESKPDYNAWWYCAFPAALPENDNLPMPFFFRGDDVEYGLRNMEHLILLNGICVWHEPFENKYSSAASYYILRNRMILNAAHGISMPLAEYKALLSGYVRYELRLYRYRTAALLMKGAEDFLSGVDWLLKQDGEALHQWVMQNGYQPRPVGELDVPFDQALYEKSLEAEQPSDLFHRALANRTLNGTWLSPVHELAIIPMEGAKQISVYRTETVLNYDAQSGKAFVTRRDPEEAKACLARLKALEERIDKDYDSVIQDYAENSPKLRALSFWKTYLDIH